MWTTVGLMVDSILSTPNFEFQNSVFFVILFADLCSKERFSSYDFRITYVEIPKSFWPLEDVRRRLLEVFSFTAVELQVPEGY